MAPCSYCDVQKFIYFSLKSYSGDKTVEIVFPFRVTYNVDRLMYISLKIKQACGIMDNRKQRSRLMGSIRLELGVF